MALENLSENISDLLQTGVAKTKEIIDAGVAKTKELTEIGKLKVDNATQQEAIKKAYLEIGKLYFAERGMDPEPPYTALCEKVAASKAKIDYNLERIEDLRAAGAPVDVEAEVEDAPETAETAEAPEAPEAPEAAEAPEPPEAPEAPEPPEAPKPCGECPCCQDPAPTEEAPAEDKPQE